VTTPASILKEHAFEAEELEKRFIILMKKDDKMIKHFAAIVAFITTLTKRNQLNLTSDRRTIDSLALVIAQFVVPTIEMTNKDIEEKK